MHCVRWVRRDRPTNRRRVCLARGHGIANREACERDSRHRRLAKVRARCVAKWRCSGWDRDNAEGNARGTESDRDGTAERRDRNEAKRKEQTRDERKTGRKSDCIRLCERRSKGLKVRAAGRSTRVLGDSGEETERRGAQCQPLWHAFWRRDAWQMGKLESTSKEQRIWKEARVDGLERTGEGKEGSMER
ncbi:hypothetical protein ERJ75_001705500 [Trypanosoma vivax]|nr:hypothetical protein ERJ75_001705500 [Trypanosoma vivax]